MNEMISVIVPAYNSEQWIESCVQSIMNQTYKNLEIIVINDGSTDETGAVIDSLARRDSRIVAHHQENKGLVLTREVGISMANGEYVAFVDSDDTIDADMYERLLSNALKYNADISHCGIKFHLLNGNKEYHYNTGRIIEQDNVTGVKDLLSGSFVEPSLCNKLYKKELCINSCLDTSVTNNEDLLRNFVLFLRSRKSVYEDFCPYNYVKRENSMSTDERQIEISKNVFKARRLIVENAPTDVYPLAVRCWLNSIVNSVNMLTFNKEADAAEYCRECRDILKKEKKSIKFLIKRQQVAAWLIVFSPSLHRLIYKVYQKKA